jgi:hypothetical protein
MQTEPSKAEPPKRKRRWIQFSLRSLMIGGTLLAIPCGYVGWQKKIVADRWALRFEIKKMGPTDNGNAKGLIDRTNANEPERAIPWLRLLLGDQAIRFVALPTNISKAYLERVKETFPEADIFATKPVPGFTMPTVIPWPDNLPAN